MADEEKKNQTGEDTDPSQNEPESTVENGDTDEQADAEAVPTTPEYAEDGEAERLPEPQNGFEDSVAAAMELSEEAQDASAVQAWDDAVTDVMEGAEEIAESTHGDAAHPHSDTVVLPYYGEITVAGGIYTVVFGALAILTVLEVMIAELFPEGWLSIALLLILAVAKAALVVMFYMHLRSDNRIFWVVLLLPMLVVLLSVLYLLAVPPEGYGVF